MRGLTVKAIVYTRYGMPDVLELKEVEKPTPADDEVLVRVRAASVNSWDWDLLRGKPFLARMEGLRKPKYTILGADIAGTVEAVGKGVRELRPGDAVFGDLSAYRWGGFAEYVCAREDDLALKSASMSFEQAAAIPQAGLLALQGLRQGGEIQPGQKILLNGAGGGVGTFALQIAKSCGAHVTCVDGAIKLERLRALGADQVVDYMVEDYTKSGERYDLILDVVATRSIFAYKRALTPQGVFVMIGGSIGSLFRALTLGAFLSKVDSRKLVILLHRPNRTDLNEFIRLMDSGKVVPVIDRTFPLERAPWAIRELGEGRVVGKVVVTMHRDL